MKVPDEIGVRDYPHGTFGVPGRGEPLHSHMKCTPTTACIPISEFYVLLDRNRTIQHAPDETKFHLHFRLFGHFLSKQMKVFVDSESGSEGAN
jgi:hypothetical protein